MKRSFTEILLEWYSVNKRDLPWRRVHDPYCIWVAEIILQQTRVMHGTAYYYRFLKAFPDILSLAAASVEQVLKIWEGLGYYTRARNMHETAQRIVREFHGKFPCKYEELLKLKGIGPYTAAAIVSIAFHQPVPVVDGNVFRVLSRLFALKAPFNTSEGKKGVSRLAGTLIPPDRPGDFNQALMEFGALQCIPGQPDCSVCPLKQWCMAKKQDIVEEIPVRSKHPRIITRYLHYLVWINNGNVLVKQRKDKDIWHKLFDFPEIVTDLERNPERTFAGFLHKERLPMSMSGNIFISGPILHQLTNRRVIARFYHVKDNKWPGDLYRKYIRAPLNELKAYAFPRLITAYMEEYPERFM